MWVFYAILSAIFAALTVIFAKIGLENVDSNLAVAIRTVVILFLAWTIVFTTGRHNEIANIETKSLIFLVFSGLATGLSWLCYYKALQIGEASKVISVDKFSLVIGMILAFVILREAMTLKTIFGGILITLGTLVLVL
jgi:transporter family protein